MAHSASRANILSKLQKALENNKTDIPYPHIDQSAEAIHQPSNLTLAEQYAIAFNQHGGRFVYCEDHDDMLMKLLMLADNMGWKNFLVQDPQLVALLHPQNFTFISNKDDAASCQGIITLCERLIAQDGAALYSSGQCYGRRLLAAAPIHITIAYTTQLVSNWAVAKQQIQQKYNGALPSMLNICAGPSQSFAVENIPITGGVGAGKCYTFLVEKMH